MALVIKAALGALVVLLIGILAKTKNYYIAGLIPLFPTFALIATILWRLNAARKRYARPSCLACGQSSHIFSTCFRCGISPVFCVFPWRWAGRWSAGGSALGC